MFAAAVLHYYVFGAIVTYSTGVQHEIMLFFQTVYVLLISFQHFSSKIKTSELDLLTN